jgi:hypothetical protein
MEHLAEITFFLLEQSHNKILFDLEESTFYAKKLSESRKNQRKIFKTKKKIAESAADPGMVIAQVKKICFPIPHRTAPKPWADPAPKMEDETIWVVLTGKPKNEER